MTAVDKVVAYKRTLAEILHLHRGKTAISEELSRLDELDELWFAMSAAQRREVDHVSASIASGELSAEAFYREMFPEVSQ